MARSHFTDPLLNNKFAVLDVSGDIPPVFLPVFGFRAVTLPTLDIDLMDIKEGNYEFPRKVIRGASVGQVTFEQGVSLINSDFYDWISKSITGHSSPKNLLIIQFHRASFDSAQSDFGKTLGAALSAPTRLTSRISSTLSPGFNFEFIDRIPGRAWILKRCKPVRYKPGSDFNAESAEVSIASLDVAVEEFNEISLAPI